MSDVEFSSLLIKSLCEFPDEVSIKRSVDELGVLITIQVCKEDMGKIIGRDGKNAQAIRVLLRHFGMKNKARINLKIEEPFGYENSKISTP